jgi:hypothetical protein
MVAGGQFCDFVALRFWSMGTSDPSHQRSRSKTMIFTSSLGRGMYVAIAVVKFLA